MRNGKSEPMWFRVRRVERQAALLERMLERLGASAGAVARDRHGAGFAEARSRCLVCHRSTECLQWLDRDEAGIAPPFCSDLRFLNAMKGPGFSA